MPESNVRRIDRPQPLTSLLASAQRLTAGKTTRVGSTTKSWQDDAWEMYDLVGEQRFLASTLAGRLAQARLYVGTFGDDATDAPVPTDDPSLTGILDVVGGSASGRAQLVQRLGVNLFVAGDGWLAGIPRHLFPPTMLAAPSLNPVDDLVPLTPSDPNTLSIDELEWRMFSVTEVSSRAGGEVTLKFGEGEQDTIICHPDDIFLIRVWRPHPRRWWEADSPTRSSLPVLRELVGLTMHISAQVDSRLAGAGLLIVPQSAQRALQAAAGIDADTDLLQRDEFTEALMEAMLTPIADRANASALVPLVVTVPDDVTSAFNFITFAKPLDGEARALRDEAIRRLALGQDAPPELLLGTAGMNHWGAWLVQEDVVTTHLEPPLALICDALTVQYLWPVLIDQGMSPEQAHEHVIWYDVSDLVIRPNRAADAVTLHAAGVLSDDALRAATGFDDAEAPTTDSLTPATRMALDLVREAPALVNGPGLPQLVAQIQTVLDGIIPVYKDPAPANSNGVPGSDIAPIPAVKGPTPPPQGLPATDAAPPPALAAGGRGSGRYPKGSGLLPDLPTSSPTSVGEAGIGSRTDLDSGTATAEELAHARDVATAKFAQTTPATDADRAKAKEKHERVARQGGDDRPNSKQRKTSRAALLTEFGDGSKAPCVSCGRNVTASTMSLDRIIPGSDGGGYGQKNLVPMDYDCNRVRSNEPFEDMLTEWSAA